MMRVAGPRKYIVLIISKASVPALVIQNQDGTTVAKLDQSGNWTLLRGTNFADNFIDALRTRVRV